MISIIILQNPFHGPFHDVEIGLGADLPKASAPLAKLSQPEGLPLNHSSALKAIDICEIMFSFCLVFHKIKSLAMAR